MFSPKKGTAGGQATEVIGAMDSRIDKDRDTVKLFAAGKRVFSQRAGRFLDCRVVGRWSWEGGAGRVELGGWCLGAAMVRKG